MSFYWEHQRPAWSGFLFVYKSDFPFYNNFCLTLHLDCQRVETPPEGDLQDKEILVVILPARLKFVAFFALVILTVQNLSIFAKRQKNCLTLMHWKIIPFFEVSLGWFLSCPHSE